MKRLFREMAELLAKRESFVTATIIGKTGSGPRSDGSRMIVRADRRISGSVGGGRLEAEALQLAAALFHTTRPAVQAFDLTGEDAAGTAMICGGHGEILLDWVDGDDPGNRALCERVVGTLERGESGCLVTAFGTASGDTAPPRAQWFVERDGRVTGSPGADPALLASLAAGSGRDALRVVTRAERTYVVEPIRHGGTVIVFGAGHVGQKLAPLAESVGFRTIVLDDRAEFASRELFAEPTRLVTLTSFEHWPELEIDEHTCLVIVTRGHLHDRSVLERTLRTNAGYVGMIGSVHKCDLVRRALLEQGFTRADLERVHAPIGTDIGAETPEEIAVSIVGELIDARARLERRRKLRGRPGGPGGPPQA